jgi:hypothetical protein
MVRLFCCVVVQQNVVCVESLESFNKQPLRLIAKSR